MKKKSLIRICFLIRQLNVGGAQRQLLELANGLDRAKYDVTIMTFYAGGALSEKALELDHVNCVHLQKSGRREIWGFFIRLLQRLRYLRPDILHSYLGVANLLCILSKPFLRKTRVIWGVRASNMDLRQYDWLARVTFRCERLLSRFANLIIVNSNAGREHLLAHGFPQDKILVVHNGIDTKKFSPDPAARQRVRREWQISKNKKLIGVIGRFDPMKDHPTFLRAAGLLANAWADVHFVCVGAGPANYEQELRALGEEFGLVDRLTWPGARTDMPAVYNALDILTSSSAFGEGFPNVIGEAMACGIPCVVTDVGDSATIVGETGVVVPPQNPQALADGWKTILAQSPDHLQSLREKTRQRIVTQFGRDQLVEKTTAALESLL